MPSKSNDFIFDYLLHICNNDKKKKGNQMTCFDILNTKNFIRHGGPYDRGGMDSYYGRPKNPHYYKGPTLASELVTEEHMTKPEIHAYHLGYDINEESGDKKNWG
tara:strand:+ start:642 stop:956 length:315 start_codon:yes stop_codon:yes gene_type:complete